MHTIVNELLPRRGMVSVVFDNGELKMIPVRKLIFHLIFFTVARKWGVTITPDFIVDTNTINSSTISELGTKILDAVRSIHAEWHDIVYDFNDSINVLNRFTIDNCQQYHKSLSILDLVSTASIPEVKKIVENKVRDPNLSMRESEKQIKANTAKLFDVLKKPHPLNKIYDFINLRFVKAAQLGHIFYQIGYRTDIDDRIIRYPVQGNYLDGLENVTEYCLEALSAKKSAFYNRDSLPTTEYFGRRQHILLSCIEHMYPGDCGTNVTMPIMITKNRRDVVIYKNIVEGSQLINLNGSNIDKYVGKIVNMRTPIACRYQDGVCEACGGTLLGSITPNTHLGIFSAMQTTSLVTQVILGNKHISDTRSIDFVIPSELIGFFQKAKGNIYVKPKIAESFKNASLVISTNDAVHLLCLGDYNLNRLSSINETLFGTCKDLVILKNGNPITDQVHLEINDQAPLYSKHLIKYISEHPDNIVIRDDMFIIDMKDFNFSNPIFKLITMNNSMVKFVKSAQMLLENRIKNYTSATALVNDFTNLVYEQVKPNIAYLEVVLRAASITSLHDYRLPIITDIDKVLFASNKDVNMRRSLGMLCAFQQLFTAFEDPKMYLIPKTFTQFDHFLNLKPKQF